MNAYIEIVGVVALSRHELTNSDLRQIGEFTRENVSAWMESHKGPDWIGILPVKDFHVVCGDNSRLRDTDIPWATEKGRLCWDEVAKERKALLEKQRQDYLTKSVTGGQ